MVALQKGKMRRSKVLEKLRAGEVAFSFKLNLDSARVAELVAMYGFDCIWSCMEHTPTDWSLVEEQIWAAKGWDVDILVRTMRGGYSDYICPLELDAAGLMVPHIMSLEDAKRVVKMTRFHPIGLRPIDGGNADGQYCQVDLADYIREANEQRFVAIQIEDPEPLAELDAIAALEGIDILFFGPADFSQGIGTPGDFNNPKIAKTRKRVVDVCRKHGKFAATTAGLGNMDELIDMGFAFLNVGADVLALHEYCGKLAEKIPNRKQVK